MGNYNDSTLTGLTGKYSKITTDNGSNTVWADNTEGKNRYDGVYTLLSTGSTSAVNKRNIYDVAGNLWEWTQESCTYSDTAGRYSLRGGSFPGASTSSGRPACYRGDAVPEDTHTHLGFRPALYIK